MKFGIFAYLRIVTRKLLTEKKFLKILTSAIIPTSQHLNKTDSLLVNFYCRNIEKMEKKSGDFVGSPACYISSHL